MRPIRDIMDILPCGICGKEHRTDRCPKTPEFRNRGPAVIAASRAKSARIAAKAKASYFRVERAMREIERERKA
jgi:hypothetical protein